ncbi:MAG: hypothetical protein WBP59_06215 [Ilumatobacteraceae bacterium]
MGSLGDIHDVLAWFLVLSNAAVGVWALAAHRWLALRIPLIWCAIGLADLSAFAVAIVGALMVNRYDIELDQFHALYGFSTIVAIGILYSYRGSPFVKDKVYLLYGLGSLFIMGLGIRAMYLGTN